MDVVVGIDQAEGQLAVLLNRVEQGEEILLVRDGPRSPACYRRDGRRRLQSTSAASCWPAANASTGGLMGRPSVIW
ncbi:MAG: hypothetical protein ACRDD1_16815 [Planctomycetia bacterium]